MAEPQPQLNILLVEDTEKHQDSAKEQFKDHALTIAKSYEEGKKYLETASIQRRYHVLLTALMMPKGGSETMGSEEMKNIFDLLFHAAKRRIPYLGIVTDINHHDHPISAAIDPISEAYWREPDSESSLYRINESKLGIFHAHFTENGRKDWNKVLEVLLK